CGERFIIASRRYSGKNTWAFGGSSPHNVGAPGLIDLIYDRHHPVLLTEAQGHNFIRYQKVLQLRKAFPGLLRSLPSLSSASKREDATARFLRRGFPYGFSRGISRSAYTTKYPIPAALTS